MNQFTKSFQKVLLLTLTIAFVLSAATVSVSAGSISIWDSGGHNGYTVNNWDRTYTGADLDLIDEVREGRFESYDFQYAIHEGDTMPGEDEWVEMPRAKEAGNYPIWYRYRDGSGPIEETRFLGYTEIHRREVTVSGIKAKDKTYDATTDAELDFDDVSLEFYNPYGASISSEGLSVTAKGVFEDANAGVDKNVRIAEITLTGDNADNFELDSENSQTSATASISKSSLTITAKDQTYYYNGEEQGPAGTVYEDPAEIAKMIKVEGLQGTDKLTGITIDGQGKDGGQEYDLEPRDARINGGNSTDNYDVEYVPGRLLIEFPPKSICVDAGADHGSAAEDLSGELQSLISEEVLPEGTEISVDGTIVNIVLPGAWCEGRTNGEIIKMLNTALGGTRDYYGEDHNPRQTGYRDAYDTEDAYKTDLTGREGDPIEDGQTYYILWDKLIKTVNVTVKDTPACGFTVTGSDYESQTPKPTFEVGTEGVDAGRSACYWWTAPSAQAGEGRLFEGTVKYGDDLYVYASLRSEFGYYFNQTATADRPATKVSVNGSEANDSRGVGQQIMFTGTIPVSGHDWGPWKVTRKPTTTAEGIETRVCKGDPSHKETRPVPKLKPQPASSPSQTPKIGGILLAKMKNKGSKGICLTWNKISGADGYDIFFSKCNKADKELKCKKVKTIKGSRTFRWTKKGLKKGEAYKAYVKAYVVKKGKKTYVRQSPMVHAYTSGGNRYFTNARAVKVKKTSVSLKKGRTYLIKAEVIKLQKGKKLMSSGHEPKLRYLSSNEKIAAVGKTGRITARAKGTCEVYVLAVNGVAGKIKIVVR